MSKQRGFTLIELVMVIVILGILAATAIPRFVDLSTDAADAAQQGVAGSVASASAINYATCSVRGNAGAGCTASVDSCQELQALVSGVTWDDGCAGTTGYDITGAAVPANAGDAYTCSLTDCSGRATGVLAFDAIGGGF